MYKVRATKVVNFIGNIEDVDQRVSFFKTFLESQLSLMRQDNTPQLENYYRVVFETFNKIVLNVGIDNVVSIIKSLESMCMDVREFTDDAPTSFNVGLSGWKFHRNF